MAAVNFPNPTETNPDTGLPYSAGWYNDANGVTYEFTNGIWSATKTPGVDFNNTFVLKSGDTMSGALEISANLDGTAHMFSVVKDTDEKMYITQGGQVRSSNAVHAGFADSDTRAVLNSTGEVYIASKGSALWVQDASNGNADTFRVNSAGVTDIRGNVNVGYGDGVTTGVALNTAGQVYVETTGNAIQVVDVTNPDNKTTTSTIDRIGNGMFAGSLEVGYRYTGTGCTLNNTGQLFIQSGTTAIQIQDANNANANSVLVSSDGSATFRGDVAVGDSATFRGTIGDAVALLPPTIAERFADAIAALPVATPYEATTLPADIPTPLRDALERATTAGKINLNSDGSATFAGKIDAGVDTVNFKKGVRINPESEGTSYLAVYGTGSGSFKAFSVYDGENIDDSTAYINHNGSATFNGRVNCGGTTANPVENNFGLAVNNSDNGTSATIYGNNGGDGSGRLLDLRSQSVLKFKVDANGSAEFKGKVIINTPNALGGKMSLGGGGTEYYVFNGIGGSAGTDGLSLGTNLASLPNDANIYLGLNGDATFKGTVKVSGGSVQPLIIGDVDSTDIDVRERLTQAKETFQQLKQAVQDAVDFDQLKASLLEALAGYEPSASTMPAPEPKKTTRKRKS